MTLDKASGEMVGIPKWLWALFVATVAWAANVTNQLSAMQVKLEYLSGSKAIVESHATKIEVLFEKLELINARNQELTIRLKELREDVTNNYQRVK